MKQGKALEKFKDVNERLVAGQPLPAANRDHPLTGPWSGYRECHLEPDWLLIYRIDAAEEVVEYVRMGSHAELFG